MLSFWINFGKSFQLCTGILADKFDVSLHCIYIDSGDVCSKNLKIYKLTYVGIICYGIKLKYAQNNVKAQIKPNS